MQVIKIGGNEIDDPQFLAGLVSFLTTQAQATVIVHGGGKEIGQLQKAFGIEAQYIDGLRVTDETSLNLVKMALCGAVNTRLVELFNRHGIEAQGLSGLDRGLIRAEKMLHPVGDLGRVGKIIHVKGELLHALLAQAVLPIIAPICGGDDGAYNVNADHVAGAVGAELGAERVVFLTNVAGVLHNGDIIPQITPRLAEELIATGVISGGMIPKVKTALDVVEMGAQSVLITNLAGLKNNTGTSIILS